MSIRDTHCGLANHRTLRIGNFNPSSHRKSYPEFNPTTFQDVFPLRRHIYPVHIYLLVSVVNSVGKHITHRVGVELCLELLNSIIPWECFKVLYLREVM